MPNQLHKRRGGWQRKLARIEVVVETQQGIIDTLVGLTRKYQTQIADLSAALAEQRHTKSQGETNPEQAGAE